MEPQPGFLPDHEAAPREPVHTRHVVSRGYLRADGLWDIESEITDTKDYPMTNLTLPLFRVALNPRFTRPFYAVPRTSAARTASG